MKYRREFKNYTWVDSSSSLLLTALHSVSSSVRFAVFIILLNTDNIDKGLLTNVPWWQFKR